MATGREELHSKVAIAVSLLWGSLIFAGGALWVEFKLSNRTPTVATVTTCASILAVYLTLTINIFRGRNWARVAYLILTIIGLPINVAIIAADVSNNPIIGLLTFMSVALPMPALWLLFTEPGKNWFQRALGSSKLTDEALYAAVLREMQAGQRQDGLWAKALADSNMHVQVAQAKYMNLRISAMRKEIAGSHRVTDREGILQKMEHFYKVGSNVAERVFVALLSALLVGLLFHFLTYLK